ncbi:MAG TPA: DNA translocase FtsK, partial [Synergistaceae bacterium]|nr:DNA translocase FtsK [Synergistaceae bacterium]
MGIFSRGKKQAEPVKRPRAAKKERPGGGALSLWLEVAVFLLFAFLLYTLASLFSLRTGAWGERIRFSLLQNMGGAILIPVLFCIYLCVAFFLKSGTANFFKQLLGSFLLFLCTALLLGLFRMARLFSASGVLSPGYLGDGLAIFFTRNIGTFGTFLLGLATLVLTATLYGLLQPASIAAKGAAFVKTLGSVRRLRPRSSREDAGDGPLPTPSPSALREDAPSLSRSRELTFSDEEQGGEFPMIPADERETPRQEPSAPEEDLPVDVAPEDGPAPDEPEGDPSAVPEIQFNEEEGSEKKVRGGTFPPPPDLFGPRQQEDSAEQNDAVREQGNAIIGTLSDFGIQAELADVIIGPTVIQFQLQLAPGIKVSRVAGLSNDLAVGLAVPAIRVEAPIPGKPYVGVEIPNPKRRGISIRTILESPAYQENENDLPLPMGVRVDSRPLVIGLEELPHLLVAGTTGSGKSVFVTSCITGLCTHRTPEELRLILIDPKRVELSIYENLPHMLAKPVVSPKKAVQALAWAVREMEHRYEVFARARVRNLKSYNQAVLPKAQLPHIVIVVDELADLMFTAQKDVEDYICRLAQMARATGIHLILATQR